MTRFEPARMRVHTIVAACAAVGALAAVPAVADEEAHAGSRVGGHIGVAVPIVTWTDGDHTDVSDDTVVAVPMGITIHRATGPLAFDMELVPAVDEDSAVGITIHPGLILPLDRVALGLRAAFDTENDALGATPLVAAPFSIGEFGKLFVEIDAPVRFPRGPVDTVYAIATHVGIAF